jgi:hypothetical protein
MLAVELSISERDDSVVVALRVDLDVTGRPDTEPAIAALMARSQSHARRLPLQASPAAGGDTLGGGGR